MAENQNMLEFRDRAEMAEWMRRMEEASQQQVKYAKQQCVWSSVRAVFSGCVLLIVVVGVLLLVPKFLAVFSEIETVMSEMETVVENLGDASDALAQTDMTEMLDGVNKLVQDSQKGVEEAMEKISAVDIDTMNSAIEDFKKVVEPLARLFGR